MTALPAPINYLNVVLAVIIFMGIMIDYPISLWLAFGSGIILDIYFSGTFGIITFSQIFTVIIIKFIFDNFFTNRSLYSLIILGIFAELIYYTIFSSINFLFSRIYFIPTLYEILWEIILGAGFLILLFSIINFTSKKFKSVFLISR